MDSLDELLAPARWDGKRCRVAQAIEAIEDDTKRAKVSAACDDNRVPPQNIHRVIKEDLGDSPAPETIRRHQTRKTNANPCKCP